jgi:hypothetical protein
MDGAHYENIRFVDIRVEKIIFKTQQRNFVLHVRQRTPGGPTGWIHHVLIRNMTVAEECPNPSRIAGFSAESDVSDVRIENLVIAGRLRLSAQDAGVEINPFAHDITFTGPAQE